MPQHRVHQLQGAGLPVQTSHWIFEPGKEQGVMGEKREKQKQFLTVYQGDRENKETSGLSSFKNNCSFQ